MDNDKLAQIEDVIVNQYAEEDVPFTKEQLESILDSIVAILDAR